MAKKNPGNKASTKGGAKARKPAPKAAPAKKGAVKSAKAPTASKVTAKSAAPKKAASSAAKQPAKNQVGPGSSKGSAAPVAGAKVDTKPVAAAGAVTAGAGAGAGDGSDGRNKPKGITIVQNKPMKKPKIKKPVEMPKLGEPLLKPGGKTKWKPLIPSGPKAPNPNAMLAHSGGDPKSKMPRKELDRYRAMLVRKRAELVGDVSTMEDEALKGSSGSLSHLPQHMADQGTETFDQALSLDLAQVDRNLIREIDDALARIEKGTYGVCELTGRLISKERLDELPWTRYSIEAARDLERRGVRG